jgi:ketosteroid isomerase-like protein
VRFDEVREIAVHETKDPEVIVVEYELTGTALATGRRGTGRFVGVLRVRDGKIAHWREYQDVVAMAETLG